MSENLCKYRVFLVLSCALRVLLCSSTLYYDTGKLEKHSALNM